MTRSTYRNENPYPFCPGCGHGPILDHLNRALVRLQLDPARLVIVSDIGCAGLADGYFETSAFHGLHGRSLTYATGLKLARPELEVIVIMGDGAAGIGGAHLVSAARRNIGVTTLVLNNLNFGMTGGQHSPTTPPGAVTATTPGGHLERPLDICATVAVNGAAYVYRGTSFDRDLGDRIAEAIETPGFSLLDVWEMCTAYFVPSNKLTRKSLLALQHTHGFRTGLIRRRAGEEYAAAYRAAAARAPGGRAAGPRPLETRFASSVDRELRLVVAGSAGGRVRSAARLLARAAVLSGLFAARRDDYPITVRSGPSVSELILSPRVIHHTGVERPDAAVLASAEGHARVAARVAAMPAGTKVLVSPPLADVETGADVEVLAPALAPALRKHMTTLALAAAASRRLGLFPPEALEAAAHLGPAAHREASLVAIRAGLAL